MDINIQLRELAASLRKIASEYQEAQTTQQVELDPEKVRDFLIFYAGDKTYAAT